MTWPTPDLPPLALSVRQPFAWAIIHAGKDIENRTWRNARTGPISPLPRRIAIHAAKGMAHDEYDAFCEFYANAAGFGRPIIPHEEDLKRGGIIGSVELVDIVTVSDSSWFEGPYGLVLRDPQPCEFIPARGALGFFRWVEKMEKTS